jgi:hypothetical protein
MYFLKCNKCGHFNEVKTEYQVFCSNCDKKMDNNFSDWKKRNHDKSFDDFKQLICTTNVQESTKDRPKEKFTRPKGLKYWIGFTVAFVIFYVIGHFAGDAIIGLFKKPFYDKAMMEVASELNKTCPIMVDNATRLDNAVALPDHVFQYNYTLVNMVKDSVNIDELKNYLEPTIINFVKSSPDMKTMRDNKSIINYYYKDKTGIYLFTISVKPEQYE